MNLDRFDALASRFQALRLAVVGDFCLDRYFEIDPEKDETSIETGLPVHNVVRVRCQPGGAGTIVNNLEALGVGQISAIGFCGVDGEGFELKRSLNAKPGVDLSGLFESSERRTFTYTKPLVVAPGQPPRELNRIDIKNWSPTPSDLAARIAKHLEQAAPGLDGLILLEQVDTPGSGVLTDVVLRAIDGVRQRRPDLLILADGRRGVKDFPPVTFKMNHAELSRWIGEPVANTVDAVCSCLAGLARSEQRVFVTMAEKGLVGADPKDGLIHVPALPVRGPIDIVGAGDSVTANLATALAAGGSVRESMTLASLASSLVIHQLGTTGTASLPELRELLARNQSS